MKSDKQKEGINAPAESFAKAFANADYKLWHANQAARYNILHGIMPPASGHWKNNPHADDIDFQIEADFIGMICPGVVNRAHHELRRRLVWRCIHGSNVCIGLRK